MGRTVPDEWTTFTMFCDSIANNFEELNVRYIKIMGEHINSIGQLTPTDVHRLDQMAKMSMNAEEIMKELQAQTAKSQAEIVNYMKAAGMDSYKPESFKNFQTNTSNAFMMSQIASQYTRAMSLATKQTLENIARTTVISKSYQKAIDKAVQTVAYGMSDYKTEMRSIVKQAAKTGMRVTYASGRTRRLDSAVNLNLMEGLRHYFAGMRQQSGMIFGADGVEISAHGMCAPDHQPYQGKQYSLADFEKLQGSLARPIGTMNCHHNISYIILGLSPPAYSEGELEQLKNYSNELIDIGGKEYTRYECSQLMRAMETKMRYTKEEIIGLKSAGMTHNVEVARLRTAQAKYKDIAEKAKLKPRLDRAYVPGYRASAQVKPSPVKPGVVKTTMTREKAEVMLTSSDIGFTSIKAGFEKLDDKLVVSNTLQLKKLEDRFNCIHDSKSCMITADNSDSSTIAFVTHWTVQPDHQWLSLCKKYFSDYDTLVAKELSMRDKFWSMPFAKPEADIFTITHEYGHMLQNILVSKKLDFATFPNKAKSPSGKVTAFENRVKKLKAQQRQEIIDIAKENNSDFSLLDNLSKYGRANDSEFFAEVFANSQLSEPNELGKAMQEWLRRQGI